MPSYSAQERFYLGTFTGPGKADGIYTGVLDSETGRLADIRLAVKANDPGYLALAPDAAHLYAVTSDGGGSVAAFDIGKNGTLSAINRVSSGGAGPCHLSVDPAGENVLVANYNGGDISCVRIREDGGVGECTGTVSFKGSGPDPERQQKAYAHFVTTDGSGRFVYSCDLGSDRVWSYHFDAATGRIGAPVETQGIVPAGSGPRHLAFGPGGDFAYVDGELARNVTVFHRDKGTGALTPVQTIPLVPGAVAAHGITAAEILCHPSGKWLYVSSRGDNLLALFAIGADGRLTFIQDAPSMVKVPRGFGIDPTGRWLIAAGQEDGRLAVFSIAAESGRLTPAGQEAAAPSAVCVLFAPAR